VIKLSANNFQKEESMDCFLDIFSHCLALWALQNSLVGHNIVARGPPQLAITVLT